MGLFDGVKDAFSAPALERSTVASERETPIDRWMGWSVASDSSGNTEGAAAASAGTSSSIVQMVLFSSDCLFAGLASRCGA